MRNHDVHGQTASELQRARRELAASLALSRPDSPIRAPIEAHMTAIDTELAERGARTASAGAAAMTANGSRDPFTVDEERALDALTLAWADEYDELWVRDGEWSARHNDAPDDDVITGSTPDELNRKIRADWLLREGP